MSKKTTGPDGKPSKIAAVRAFLTENPHAKASEISNALSTKHGLTISPKVASTYRYHILSSKRRKARRAAGMKRGTAASRGSVSEAAGMDDLLRAAAHLGWQRLKEVVDKVIQAPA